MHLTVKTQGGLAMKKDHDFTTCVSAPLKRRFLLSSAALLLVWFIAHPAVAEDLQQLKQIQTKIQSVVTNNMAATVAVTGGNGFGSGVIVSKDGLILTAAHVMKTVGMEYRVILPSGREVKARALGMNENVDAGMMQITEPGPWPFVELGARADLEKGNWCVCLGHPGGYEVGRKPPVRAGKIRRFKRTQIVTDAVLIGGDSGGPLFDLDGKLIGIHSSIGDSIAENRHVTIDTFRSDWERMRSGEKWGKLPDLGAPEPQGDRAALGIVVDRSHDNAAIVKVHDGSIADIVGMKVGDIVEKFDGQDIQSSTQLIEIIKSKRPGDRVEVTINRNGTRKYFVLHLGSMK